MLHHDPAAAVGHIPSGLFIVAVQNPETKEIDGYLASWIQQVSFNPLLVTLAIKPGRPAYDLIKAGLPFAINVVGDHDKTYLRHFWRGYDANQNPFHELATSVGSHGGILLNQAKSSIECQLVDCYRPGDHELVVAKVLASTIFAEESRAMVHVRKSGKDY
jgi:flavin reductase (DIM6/NTAB) family NADH-FMN oxidoreductase RutF